MADDLKFFHWELAFPNVFSGANPAFDCVLGNPPWERIKLQEEEFFAQRAPEIATAQNKAARQKLINALPQLNPALEATFKHAKHATECSSKFVRQSMRFPLTAVGDVNTYALFAELVRNIVSSSGQAGIIVPTGIATDDNTKEFFADLLSRQSVDGLLSFENEAFIFSNIHHSFKFCALTILGSELHNQTPEFVFFIKYFHQLTDPTRRFRLSSADIELFNPNTRNLPIFRTKSDVELTRNIYKSVPVLENEKENSNPMDITFFRMFDMSKDSNLFEPKPKPGLRHLYEAKMIHQFDHRWATYSDSDIRPCEVAEKVKPDFSVIPNYWINENEIKKFLLDKDFAKNCMVGIRAICRSHDERTTIATIMPYCGMGHSIALALVKFNPPFGASLFLANYNSLTFDYIVRQKYNSAYMSQFVLKQLPVLPPSAYAPADIEYITPRVLELVYTAYDLKPFAEDMGYHGEPFRWDEERRALLRAELDAYYAKLYGLTRDELRYILDPQDVYGPDFPGETFRVLKEKEIKQFGEYLTRRLVLEAWDRLAERGVEVGNPDGYLTDSHMKEAESAPPREVITIQPENKEDKPASPPKAAPRLAVKEQEESIPAQPSFSDFGLYKCESCGKMVMGFEKEKHAFEAHGGKKVVWKKLR